MNRIYEGSEVCEEVTNYVSYYDRWYFGNNRRWYSISYYYLGFNFGLSGFVSKDIIIEGVYASKITILLMLLLSWYFALF